MTHVSDGNTLQSFISISILLVVVILLSIPISLPQQKASLLLTSILNFPRLHLLTNVSLEERMGKKTTETCWEYLRMFGRKRSERYLTCSVGLHEMLLLSNLTH
jgi:hypothetical protein